MGVEKDLDDLTATFAEIMNLAEERYREHYPERGSAWRDGEARFHLFKAIDEFCAASYHQRKGDDLNQEIAMENVADGLNHLLMAVELFDQEARGCHPSVSDDPGIQDNPDQQNSEGSHDD